MKILHYSLGFPPFRRGGMTQYCVDLMIEQIKNGNSVAMLWPGKLHDLSENSSINKHKNHLLKEDYKCDSYEIVNPLPIPLMDGIIEPKMYMISKKIDKYQQFFKRQQFDILHIHTFMGLPEEIITAAKNNGILVIYTSHDYFSVCPRCNLFYSGQNCVHSYNCENCVDCNKNGLTYKKMKFLQSDLYKKIKDNAIVKILRKHHNNALYYEESDNKSKYITSRDKQLEYRKLRRKNIEILEKLDIVHFNSKNTLKIYKEFGYSGRNAKIISIANGAIKNNKAIREVHNSVRFGYLGPITKHKGFNLLYDVCKKLTKSNIYDFEVHIFVEINNLPEYFLCHKPYRYEELADVMDKFDILVVPSEWNETFGFTVLEALSYGIPVIVSNNVGAKDLIEQAKNGYIISVDDNGEELFKVMKNVIIDKQKVSKMSENIYNTTEIKSMSQHNEEIEQLYRRNANND